MDIEDAPGARADGRIAHDVLNGVAALRGTSVLLRDRWRELSDEVRDELLDTVARQSEKLAQVLDSVVPNLSDASRIELRQLVEDRPLRG